jgi:hypothetical protein
LLARRETLRRVSLRWSMHPHGETKTCELRITGILGSSWKAAMVAAI